MELRRKPMSQKINAQKRNLAEENDADKNCRRIELPRNNSAEEILSGKKSYRK